MWVYDRKGTFSYNSLKSLLRYTGDSSSSKITFKDKIKEFFDEDEVKTLVIINDWEKVFAKWYGGPYFFTCGVLMDFFHYMDMDNDVLSNLPKNFEENLQKYNMSYRIKWVD